MQHPRRAAAALLLALALLQTPASAMQPPVIDCPAVAVALPTLLEPAAIALREQTLTLDLTRPDKPVLSGQMVLENTTPTNQTARLARLSESTLDELYSPLKLDGVTLSGPLFHLGPSFLADADRPAPSLSEPLARLRSGQPYRLQAFDQDTPLLCTAYTLTAPFDCALSVGLTAGPDDVLLIEADEAVYGRRDQTQLWVSFDQTLQADISKTFYLYSPTSTEFPVTLDHISVQGGGPTPPGAQVQMQTQVRPTADLLDLIDRQLGDCPSSPWLRPILSEAALYQLDCDFAETPVMDLSNLAYRALDQTALLAELPEISFAPGQIRTVTWQTPVQSGFVCLDEPKNTADFRLLLCSDGAAPWAETGPTIVTVTHSPNAGPVTAAPLLLEETDAQTSLATVNGPLPASVQLVWRQSFRAPGGDGILGRFWLVYLVRWPVTFPVTGLLLYGLYRLLRRKKPVEEP